MIKLVGILNITPDSFSDGGKFYNSNNALIQTQKLIKDGANIIDVGAESTRPGATPIDKNQEWQRLENILPKIIKIAHQNNVKISLDSRHYQTIKKALDLGIDIINDVTGFDNKDMALIGAKSNKKLIVMHNLGVPARKDLIIDQNLDEIEEIKNWMKKKISFLQELGVKKENIIFDPGVGFGKNAKQSINILNNINQFKDLGLEIFIGHSKKSFLDEVNEKGDRDSKTIFVSKNLIGKGVRYLRVHDVSNHKSLL